MSAISIRYAQVMQEVWLRGPLPAIPAELQPIAHALLQCREEVLALLEPFPERLLWERPAGLASVGFHLQHLTGVLDRLFTYARGEALSSAQRAYLKAEGQPLQSKADLLEAFSRQVDETLELLKTCRLETLLEPRKVGRAGLPSTMLRPYTHAAEHSMRHLGQLLVTVKVLQAA